MSEPVRLFTIGFTQKNASTFFELLGARKVKLIIDTRLNNSSQLAGFSKKDDLAYFARRLCGAEYWHFEDSAPTENMLKAYKSGAMSWSDYAVEYKSLIERRHVERQLKQEKLDYSCLLCSESKPHHCHRSILADYITNRFDIPITVVHL